jgi:hypothetical protein
MNTAAALDYYKIVDDQVPTVKRALSIERELVNVGAGTGDNTSHYTSCEYSVTGAEPGIELNDYRLYLEQNEGFIMLTDADFGEKSGSSAQMGKDAKMTGYALILEFAWDAAGYTIKMSYVQGAVTAHEQPAAANIPAGIANPTAYAALAPFLQALSDKVFTYGFTTEFDGIEFEGYNTQRGDEFCSALKYTIDGIEYGMFTIIKGGYTYIGGTDSKNAVKTASTVDDMENLNNDYSGVVVTGSGTGTIDGASMPYVEYGAATGESYGRYYIQNGDVYAVEFADGSTMYITEYFDEPAPDLFEIPDDYTVTED